MLQRAAACVSKQGYPPVSTELYGINAISIKFSDFSYNGQGQVSPKGIKFSSLHPYHRTVQYGMQLAVLIRKERKGSGMPANELTRAGVSGE